MRRRFKGLTRGLRHRGFAAARRVPPRPARHSFSEWIIRYAVNNATLEVPRSWSTQEVEVMHDEVPGDGLAPSRG